MRLIALGALALAGCGPDAATNAEDCDPAADPGLEIGVGAEAFQTLDEAGGEATLIHGAQGGYHLELGLRAQGVVVDELANTVFEGRVNGQLLANNSTWVQFRCNPDSGAAETWNVRLIFDAQPEDLDGQQADVTATLTDGAGTTVEASASLKIVDPLVR